MSGVIVCLILHLHLSYFLPREFNGEISMKRFSESILQEMREGDEIKTSYFTPPGLLFYTKKPYIEDIRSPKRFQEIMKSPQRVFVVIQKMDLRKIFNKNHLEVHTIDRRKVRQWDLVLISNHPDEATSTNISEGVHENQRINERESP